MSMHNHVALEELTTLALGGADAAETASLTRSLRVCAHCQGELAQIREDLGLYARTTTMYEVTEERRARMLDRVAREKRQVVPPWPIVDGHSGSKDALLKVERKPDEGAARTPLHSV